MSSFNPYNSGASFTLIGQTPPFEGATLQVSGMTALVGRDPDCQVHISAAVMSRHHARFSYNNGAWYIEDLKSTNGTYLNGTPVLGQMPVPPGSIVAFGTVLFQFQSLSSPNTMIAPRQPQAFTPPPPSADVWSSPQPAPPPLPSWRGRVRNPEPPRPARPPRRRGRSCLISAFVLLAGACALVFALPLLGPYLPAQYAKYTDIPQLITDWWDGTTIPTAAPIVTLEPTGLTVSETGFAIESVDGAKIEFPPNYGEPDQGSAAFTKLTDPSGEATDYGAVVSGMYELAIPAPDKIYSSLTASLPIDRALTQGMDLSSLQPYALNQSTGEWVPVGTLMEYDAATSTLVFDLPFTYEAALSGKTACPNRYLYSPIFQPIPQTHQAKTQLRIEGTWFSNWKTTSSPDSKFTITYYPDLLGGPEVKNDEWWNSQTGHAVNPAVPDYIEDLDAALNQAYEGLLKIPKLGGMLFAPLSEPIAVTVKNTGTAEGSVFLPTGSMSITNYKLKTYDEMRKVVGHELTHLLQDQYYNTFNAANNKWFFEATAEHFSMRTNGFSDAQRGPFYEEGGTDYLQVPLTTSSEKNMYFVGHFLDWITKQYGETVIPTALELGSYGTIFRDDLQYLERALHSNLYQVTIEEVYTAFGRYLVSHPADYGGINGDLKGKLQNIGQTHISTRLPVFTDDLTYIQFSQKAPQLTMASLLLVARNTRSAALVIDSTGTTGGTLTAFTYAFPARANRDYNTPSLDPNLAFPYAAPLMVPDFYAAGTSTILEQSFTNAHRTQGGDIQVTYYLLVAPKILSVDDGRVGWSNADIGNLPRAYIKGYNVYRNGVRLNSAPVPDPGAGIIPLYNDDRIKAGDPIVVSIIDQYGNMWPKVVEVTPTETPTPTPTISPTPTLTPTPTLEGLTGDGVTEQPPDDAPFDLFTRDNAPKYVEASASARDVIIAYSDDQRDMSPSCELPFLYENAYIRQTGPNSTTYVNNFVTEVEKWEFVMSQSPDNYIDYGDFEVPVRSVQHTWEETYNTTVEIDTVNKTVSITCSVEKKNKDYAGLYQKEFFAIYNLPIRMEDSSVHYIAAYAEGTSSCNYLQYDHSGSDLSHTYTPTEYGSEWNDELKDFTTVVIVEEFTTEIIKEFEGSLNSCTGESEIQLSLSLYYTNP